MCTRRGEDPGPRCLHPPASTTASRHKAKAFVDMGKGLLVLDDTTLDKPYAHKMDLVTYHWSGKHQRVVKGIALLLWTEGKALIPCDFLTSPRAGRPRTSIFKRCCGKLGNHSPE